jgi:hypothetical protein
MLPAIQPQSKLRFVDFIHRKTNDIVFRIQIIHVIIINIHLLVDLDIKFYS